MPKGTRLLRLIRPNKFTLLSLLLLVPMYIALYKIYMPHVNAFGCFDDCFYFLGGFFISKGKHIYSDFFFNHQPLGAYISFTIQYFTHPQNIFELILRHRQFVLLFGLFFNTLLILRFGIRGLLFVILFEFSKFYVFGDRFLPEGLIVYPLVYLTGIALLKLSNKKPLNIDYLLAGVFTWFIFFMREPYIPLALILYLTVIWDKNFSNIKRLSLFILVALSFLTIAAFDIKEYFFNLITVNLQVVLPNEIKGQLFGGPAQILFYPLFIPFFGPINSFKLLLLAIDTLFLIFFIKLLKDRRYILSAFIFLTLGAANLKVNLPGKLFYEAFHMIIWFGLFIFITIFMVLKERKNKLLFIPSILVLSAAFLIFIASPSYFGREKVDQQYELLTNYGQTLQEGEVIKILSDSSDKIFLDGSDDLVYWQANRLSSYKYTWYTSVMGSFAKYNGAKQAMFKNNPPDLYREFGSCPKKAELAEYSLPGFLEKDYVRLTTDNKPSCIFISREKLKKVTPAQWKKASQWHYDLLKDETN